MSFSCTGILMFRYGQAWSTQYFVDDTRCPSGFGCVSKNVTERTTTTTTTTTTKTTTTTTTAATTTVTTFKGMPSSFVIRIVPVLLLGPRLHQASASTLQQLCDDTPEWVCNPFSSDSIYFSENRITSIISEWLQH